MLYRWCWFGLLLLGSASALAQSEEVGLGMALGTLGTAPQLEVRLSDSIKVRADAALLRTDFPEFDAESDDLFLDGAFRARSTGAMIDYYPTRGGLRLSSGLRYSAVRAKLKATPTTNVTIGTRTVTPIQVGTLSADYRLRDWAPAATIGYAGDLGRRLVVSFEAGLLFHGAPHIRRLHSIRETLSSDPGFAVNVNRERMLIENDVRDYKIYPTVQSGLSYRF